MSDRPNILYFMTDQHRADWLGCAGHPIVKTPNIDRLANRGTRFTNFYVNSPICMPNRAAVMTGRYPSVNGARHNGLPLPQSANTFVDVLRLEGYDTASIGKSHHQPFTDRPMVRTDEHPSVNANIPEAKKSDGFDYLHEHPATYVHDVFHEVPTPYYGFDHVRLVTGHSDECGGHYLQWLRSKASDWQELRDRNNQYAHNFSCPQARRTKIPENLYPTSYIRDEAKSYLKDRASSDNPFFAFVSFPDPHHPFTPPGKYWDMYDPEDFSVDLPYEAHKTPPPQLQAWKKLMDDGVVPSNEQQAFMTSVREIKEAMALSAGMITMIDDAIGDILKTLEDTGQADNTIIIFNSDHGDYLGAFSLLLKGPFSHSSVNRVPFIWFDPRRETAKIADGLAASIDIAPTILERVGALPYYGMQGLSFLQQLNGKPSERGHVLIEHEENKVYPGFDRRPNMRNLVTPTHRLTIYKGQDFGELYDTENDPDETMSLWSDPVHANLKSDLLFALNQAMLDAIEPGPWPRRFA